MNNDFNQKMTKFMRTSDFEDKRLENIYNKNLVNKYSVNSFFKINNEIHDFLYLKNKKNKQNIKNNSNKKIYNNSSINRKNEQISLYKKYKKYNSINDGQKSNTCKNIILNEYNNYQNSSHLINNYSLSSKIKNQKISHNNRNILLTNLAMNKFYNDFSKNKNNSKQNKTNSKNSFNENFEYSSNNNINKEKLTSSRVENRIIQKIQLIENENKENRVKNLLINRPPRVLNNDVFKFDTSDYSYFLPTTRYKNKSVKSIKNLKKYKSNNLFNLDSLNDIIFSIRNIKLNPTRNRGNNNMNNKNI